VPPSPVLELCAYAVLCIKVIVDTNDDVTKTDANIIDIVKIDEDFFLGNCIAVLVICRE
jgi:hypothetical protein